MAVAVAGLPVLLAQAEHLLPHLRVGVLDPVRVIRAAGRGRGTEEGVVRRGRRRRHERFEDRVHG